MDMTRMLGPGEGYEGESGPEEGGHNPLATVHLLLQGRYWVAIVLALVLAIVGALLGFKLGKPTWSSTGTLHIRPVISPLLFDKGGTMPMYDQFVQTQVTMLKNERCIDMAMGSPKWLDEGRRSNTPEAAAEFKKHLEVSNAGEIIKVTYWDTDPRTASDAVAAMIEAYLGLTKEIDPEQPLKRQQQLETLKGEYENKLANSRQNIAALASPYTPDALMDRYKYKMSEANQAESDWSLSKAALERFHLEHPDLPDPEAPAATQAGGAPASGPSATAPSTAAAPATALTPEEIAKVDAEMAQLLQARRSAQMEADQLLVGPNHPLKQARLAVVAMLDRQIAERTATFKPEATGSAASPVLTPLAMQEQLHRKVEWAETRLVAVKKEVAGLAEQVMKVTAAQADQQQWVSLLEETKQKLEEVHVEAAASGRILVLNPNERPVRHDPRLPLAAGVGFGGILLGFGIMIVAGLMDRSLRTIEQARNSLKQNLRVLGMLPSLPKNLEDPASASFAALCVHHIRMLLQVMPRLDGHPAIAVTSPSPGDGKTSLSLALSLSYAASGKSTLMIDCDIVGAGLTRRVNAIIRRRIGQILMRENIITATELREALGAAQRSGRKLGEVLVDEGYVDAEQLAKALKEQVETSVGLLDVLRGEALEECVAETGTARLWILPVGSALAEHGATISPEGFRSVLEQARKRFEVIIIDTGPVPGAIESSVAASQADGIVLTVSRGEQGPLVKRAAEHLRDIGGRTLGLVFNRATPEDFNSSYGSMSSPSIPDRTRVRAEGAAAFGPVAAAVAGQQKALREGGKKEQ